MFTTYELHRSTVAHVRRRLLAGERVDRELVRKLRAQGLWPYQTDRPGIENPGKCLSDRERSIRALEVLFAEREDRSSA